ncbi:MAG: hypothetical protein AAGH15_07510 [Myxococcota bacterium]
MRLLWNVALAAGLLACGGSAGGADAGGGDAELPRRDLGRDLGRPEPCRVALPVDLVFMIDDSSSMEEEQASLAANFPRLIEGLTNPPDDDGDGEPDFPPLDDLRVAVVTPNLGVGDADVIGCPRGEGDDGAFVRASRAGGSCEGVSTGDDPWLSFAAGDDPAELAADFACLAALGTAGCGLEQPLESVLRSITTRAEPGEPNAGFLRPSSLVAFVFVTDEDDCSVTDPAFFDASDREVGEIGTRCALPENAGRLHPITRYVDALRALGIDRRGDILVAAITGLPRELVDDPAAVDFDAVLADERMQIEAIPNPDVTRTGDVVRPACSFGGVGSAPPARRIIELVRAFGETGDGILDSICRPDVSDAVEAIAASIGGRICDAPI